MIPTIETVYLLWLLFSRVGGSLPVAFSYFCEFFSKRTKGPFVIVLAGFWIIGSVFASLLALAVIEPLKDHLSAKMGEPGKGKKGGASSC